MKRYIMAVDGEDVVFKVNNYDYYDYYRLLPKTTVTTTTKDYREHYRQHYRYHYGPTGH